MFGVDKNDVIMNVCDGFCINADSQRSGCVTLYVQIKFHNMQLDKNIHNIETCQVLSYDI